MSEIEQTLDENNEDAEMDEGSEGFEDDSDNIESVYDEEEVNEEEEEDEDEDEDGEEPAEPPQTYLPGKPLEEGEVLECDESAYIMLHQANTGIISSNDYGNRTMLLRFDEISGAPCLSFDIIPDGLGEERTDFPQTTYLISGTQGSHSFTNRLIVMKMSNMQKTQPRSESDSEDSEDEEDTVVKPDLDCAIIHHQGAVNRVRVCFIPLVDEF